MRFAFQKPTKSPHAPSMNFFGFGPPVFANFERVPLIVQDWDLYPRIPYGHALQTVPTISTRLITFPTHSPLKSRPNRRTAPSVNFFEFGPAVFVKFEHVPMVVEQWDLYHRKALSFSFSTMCIFTSSFPFCFKLTHLRPNVSIFR